MPSPRNSTDQTPGGTGLQALPPQFKERICKQFPKSASHFLNALDKPPVTSVRLNPHKWANNEKDKHTGSHKGRPFDSRIIRNHFGTDVTPVPWAENGWILRDRPSFTLDPLLHAGCYYVQEAGSMFLEYVLSSPEIREQCDIILDACAAPGGKSTLIASMFPGSLIVANEVIRSRIPSLLENFIKWGTGNGVVTQSDTRRLADLKAFFDVAVVDAPCSGEGLFRKDPAARKEWSADNAHHCTLRQRNILMDTWETIRPGGHLIYSTCTFNPDENELNVKWLLNQTGGKCVPVSLNHELRELITEIHENGVKGYGLYPHTSPGEGFFLSIIHKPLTGSQSQPRRPVIRADHLSDPDPSAIKNIGNWFEDDADFRFFQIKNRLFRIHKKNWEALNVLAKQLPVRYAGTEAAGIFGEDVRPAAASALDMNLNTRHFPNYNLSRDDALRFLRRENVPVPESAETGWYLAMHRGIPLGWLKNIGRRMNNYYPLEWRIRQQNS